MSKPKQMMIMNANIYVDISKRIIPWSDTEVLFMDTLVIPKKTESKDDKRGYKMQIIVNATFVHTLDTRCNLTMPKFDSAGMLINFLRGDTDSTMLLSGTLDIEHGNPSHKFSGRIVSIEKMNVDFL